MKLMGKRSEDNSRSPDEVTSVGVQVAARNRLNAYCLANHNANLKDVLTTLVNWFTDQPEIVKDAVMGRVRPEVASAYALALRKLSEDVEVRTVPTDKDLAALDKHLPKKTG